MNHCRSRRRLKPCRDPLIRAAISVLKGGATSQLHSLQFIGADGNKRFLSGGRVVGCYFSLGRPKGAAALCICEGVATGASIHEATGYPLVVAFNAGNLLPVAKAMRKRFPELHLIVCGDDDAKTPGNPGRTKATEAAHAVGGRLVVPDFGQDRPEGATDFNDLHRHAGLQAVRAVIERAALGAPTFITAATLWDMQHDSTRWAVPGILPEGVTILGGKPKVGKSWLALDLALAAGTGGRALGCIEVDAGPVLYLALEDTKRRLTKRLRILCGDTTPPPQQIEFLTDCPRLGSGGEEVLRVWLRDHPTARLITIDTLPRFRPPGNARETPYANDYVVGEYLSRLCVEFQVSILALGHLRKQPGDDPIDEISGTLGLVGGVDGYMVLRRQAMSDDATLYVCGRDVDEPAEYCMAWDRDRARWSITGGDPRVSRLPAEQRRVYELLSEAPKNIKELTEALNPGHVVDDPAKDSRRKAASGLVHKLKDKGLIERRTYDARWWPYTSQNTTSSSSSTSSGSSGSSSSSRTASGEGKSASARENVSDELITNEDVSAITASSAVEPGGDGQPMDEIRGWLQRLGEKGPETISEVLEACARDPAVMAGYLRSAREGPS